MHVWYIEDHARQRCSELRSEAERCRLVRTGRRAERAGLRRRVASGLFAVGSLFVAAAARVSGDASAREQIVA